MATKIPTDLLEAQSETDNTLQFIVAGMGLLALVVGGVGIANVMSISVIQRSSEIGIRRALGHSRSTVALQFLLEALGVGILGGLLGVVVGVAAMWIGHRPRGLGLHPAALAAVGRPDRRGDRVDGRRHLPGPEGGPPRTPGDPPPRLISAAAPSCYA